MSVIQKNHDVDLEAAKFNDTCVGDGIGSDPEVKDTVLNSKISQGQEVSNLSDCSVDLESGVIQTRACLVRTDVDCRICHLSLENQESGVQFELGCACKNDLAAAHKHCAETWFKIKGNRTCEICGSVAQHVVDVQEAELSVHQREINDSRASVAARVALLESTNSRKGHKFLILLIMCLACAIIMAWRFQKF